MDRQNRLLELIREDSYITYKELSDRMHLSKRTIYSEIADLNDLLLSHGACIETKPRYGVRILVNDQKKFSSFKEGLGDTSFLSYEDSHSRVLQIAGKILSSAEPVKMDDLCEELYISRSTLNKDLKKVKSFLREYDLQLGSVAYKGTQAMGSENSVRRCLSEISRQLKDERDGQIDSDMDAITDIARKVFSQEGLRIPEYLFNNLIVHLYIAIMRIRNGFVMKDTDAVGALNDEDLRIAERLTDEIGKAFDVQFSDAETAYVSLTLKSRQLRDLQDNSVIPVDIYEIVMEMLDEIDQMFSYDFKYDLELVSLLASHMVSLEM